MNNVFEKMTQRYRVGNVIIHNGKPAEIIKITEHEIYLSTGNVITEYEVNNRIDNGNRCNE